MPLSEALKDRLGGLLHAFAQGCGPLEQAVLGRLDTAPMTPADLRVHADVAYPDEVRRLLDRLGYDRLYRDDLARARALQDSFIAITGPQAGAAPRRGSHRPPASVGGRRRIVGLARLVLLGVVVWLAAWPGSTGRDRAGADPAGAGLTPPPVVVAAPISVPRSAEARACRQDLRDDAVSWCARALGAASRPPTTPSTRAAEARRAPGAACGEPLVVNSDTLRRALDRLLESGQAYSYRPDEVPARCAAAAALALPP